MSLLDGPELVTVFPQVPYVDGDGNRLWRASDVGVVVRAHVQPVSSTEDTSMGQAVTSRWRVIAREAPAGPWSHILWRGHRFAVEGEPAVWPGPAHLRHTTIVVRGQSWHP